MQIQSIDSLTREQAVEQLRAERAANQELRQQLEAIGAGGVSGERVMHPASVPSDDVLRAMWIDVINQDCRTLTQHILAFAHTLLAKYGNVQVAADADDADLGHTIDQRDIAEGWADGLAGLIGQYFGQEIGEHSSAHCPWQEAKGIIEEALAAKTNPDAAHAQELSLYKAEIERLNKQIYALADALDFGADLLINGEFAQDDVRGLVKPQSTVRDWQEKNGVELDPESREGKMVVIRQNPDGEPIVWCDPEISDLVDALNNGVLSTVASCSGHGEAPGFVAMSDGRYLAVHASLGDYKATIAAQPNPDAEDAARWISVNERLPEIHEWSKGSVAGISEPVLTVDISDPDNPSFQIQYLRKGGRGDLTTCYWEYDDSPTHWMPAPKLPAIDPARGREVE